MRLYRVIDPTNPYLGPGSFWAESPQDAIRFGDSKRTKLVFVDTDEPILRLLDDEALISTLLELGFPDAEDLVVDADWIQPRVLQALRRLGYAWLSRPIDLNSSTAREYVRL